MWPVRFEPPLKMYVDTKVVLITGGLGGIGYALAKDFLRNGAKGVALLDVDDSKETERLQELWKEFGDNRAIFIKCDITKQSDLEKAFDTTVNTFKNLDIVVNCAAIIDNMYEPTWEKSIDINYVACHRIILLAMKSYLPKYKSKEVGLIIIFSSIAGIDPMPTKPNYSATKSALIALGRSYGTSLHQNQHKTSFLTICPGYTITPLVKNVPLPENLHAEFPNQMPEEISRSVMGVLSEFQNGDVYVCEGGEYYKMTFSTRKDSKNK